MIIKMNKEQLNYVENNIKVKEIIKTPYFSELLDDAVEILRFTNKDNGDIPIDIVIDNNLDFIVEFVNDNNPFIDNYSESDEEYIYMKDFKNEIKYVENDKIEKNNYINYNIKRVINIIEDSKLNLDKKSYELFLFKLKNKISEYK